ncbi:hypothetical protein DL763_007353 [Monosporascus cannonballus]|nr:hypothetical protein DL763_007353 [Monosporascus cannonballus]
MAASRAERPHSPSHSQLPPIPDSPTYSYASTANRLSSYNLPLPPPPRPAHTVLTKADLEQSQQAYSDLLATAKSYRVALATLSTAASAFGSALEACARLKESRAESLIAAPPGGGASHHQLTASSNSFAAKGSCTADLILSAGGVHHLIANHQQILSETVYRSFEVPLLHELDAWRRAVDDEEECYKAEVAVRSREIRRLEKEGLKLHRQRRRDVSVLREHLVELTARLDGLTVLHADHARALLRDSQEASARVLDAGCSLVRAEVDIFESLARKGWSGGGLDELLEKGRDLFASEDDAVMPVGGILGNGGAVGTAVGAAGAPAMGGGGVSSEGGEAKLFSILPPKSILADTASDKSRPSGGPGSGGWGSHHGRADSLLISETDRYQSLVGAVSADPSVAAAERERNGTEDNESVFSDLNLSVDNVGHQTQTTTTHPPPRGLRRPFSPQPIRRLPTDVIMDPDSLLSDDDEFGDESGRRLGRLGDLFGARDASAQGLFKDDDDDDDDDDKTVSPWKDEGLRRTRESEEGDDRDSAGGGDARGTPRPHVDLDVTSSAEEREQRWSEGAELVAGTGKDEDDTRVDSIATCIPAEVPYTRT